MIFRRVFGTWDVSHLGRENRSMDSYLSIETLLDTELPIFMICTKHLLIIHNYSMDSHFDCWNLGGHQTLQDGHQLLVNEA